MSVATLEKPGAKLAELRVFQHSDLLYWWPAWAVALGMALWTYLDGHHLILAPEGTVIEAGQATAPEGSELVSPLVHVARSRVPGLLFVFTLLAIIVCTHAWIRGPWALLFTTSILMVVLFISWLDWWDPLLRWFRALHVYINLGGYLVFGVVTLTAWLLALFVLDHRTYMVFSVGQLRFVDRLGDEERAYDTSHVVFEKRPYDWFRRVIGLGAGDMIIRIGGAQPQVFELHNVIRVGSRLQVMESRLRTKDVV